MRPMLRHRWLWRMTSQKHGGVLVGQMLELLNLLNSLAIMNICGENNSLIA